MLSIIWSQKPASRSRSGPVRFSILAQLPQAGLEPRRRRGLGQGGGREGEKEREGEV